MNNVNLIQEVFLFNGKACNSAKNPVTLYENPKDFCQFIGNYGADAIYIAEKSENDAEHELNIDIVKEIVSNTDVPIFLGGSIERLEDVKKYLYTGASYAILNMGKPSNQELIKEASERFGSEKIAVLVKGRISAKDAEFYKEQGASLILKTEVSIDDCDFALPVMYVHDDVVMVEANENSTENLEIALSAAVKLTYHKNVYGYSYICQTNKVIDYMNLKTILQNEGIPVKTNRQKIKFSELKSNNDGLVPVIVQDYKTNEVLMLAYMNEEAFDYTIKTGRMTYYSRSRKELWEKGLTSGHFQYFKELTADCDNDTILAKVFQVGAACHTGSRNCFFNEIVKKEYVERNPHKVFEDVLNVILDRKENPKEGSYTNYLFDKGIDKILKKVGEEATEIIIAAKNPNSEEIKYEISDFLYHVMVLMAERGVTWEDITTELAHR